MIELPPSDLAICVSFESTDRLILHNKSVVYNARVNYYDMNIIETQVDYLVYGLFGLFIIWFTYCTWHIMVILYHQTFPSYEFTLFQKNSACWIIFCCPYTEKGIEAASPLPYQSCHASVHLIASAWSRWNIENIILDYFCKSG